MAEYSLPRVECRIYMNEAGKLYSETPITSAEGAIQLMAAELKDMDREMLCVLNLDNKSRPLNYHVVSIGTASASLAAIGNCLKTALLSGAVSIIAMHNHLSGIPEPSPEDRAVTEKLRNAARILEINFLDHLVVGKDGAWSIAHNHPIAYRDPGALFSEQETVYSAGEPQEGNQDMFYLFRVRPYIRVESGNAYGKWSSALPFCGGPRGVVLEQDDGLLSVRWKKVKGAASYTIYVSASMPKKLGRMKKVKTTKSLKLSLTSFRGERIRYEKVYYVAVVANRKAGKKTYHSKPDTFYYIE